MVLADGCVEPLEVTRFVDRPALETWERLRKHTSLTAPSLTRRWVLAAPIVDTAGAGSRVPYDVQGCGTVATCQDVAGVEDTHEKESE